MVSFSTVWLVLLGAGSALTSPLSPQMTLISDFGSDVTNNVRPGEAGYYLLADVDINPHVRPTDELKRTQRSFWKKLLKGTGWADLFGDDCDNCCNNYNYGAGNGDTYNSPLPLSPPVDPYYGPLPPPLPLPPLRPFNLFEPLFNRPPFGGYNTIPKSPYGNGGGNGGNYGGNYGGNNGGGYGGNNGGSYGINNGGSYGGNNGKGYGGNNGGSYGGNNSGGYGGNNGGGYGGKNGGSYGGSGGGGYGGSGGGGYGGSGGGGYGGNKGENYGGGYGGNNGGGYGGKNAGSYGGNSGGSGGGYNGGYSGNNGENYGENSKVYDNKEAGQTGGNSYDGSSNNQNSGDSGNYNENVVPSSNDGSPSYDSNANESANDNVNGNEAYEPEDGNSGSAINYANQGGASQKQPEPSSAYGSTGTPGAYGSSSSSSGGYGAGSSATGYSGNQPQILYQPIIYVSPQYQTKPISDSYGPPKGEIDSESEESKSTGEAEAVPPYSPIAPSEPSAESHYESEDPPSTEAPTEYSPPTQESVQPIVTPYSSCNPCGCSQWGIPIQVVPFYNPCSSCGGGYAPAPTSVGQCGSYGPCNSGGGYSANSPVSQSSSPYSHPSISSNPQSIPSATYNSGNGYQSNYANNVPSYGQTQSGYSDGPGNGGPDIAVSTVYTVYNPQTVSRYGRAGSSYNINSSPAQFSPSRDYGDRIVRQTNLLPPHVTAVQLTMADQPYRVCPELFDEYYAKMAYAKPSSSAY